MTHLELENLASEYLEGQLEPVRRAEVESHLKDCAPCRELVADVRRALELFRTAEDLEPSPWLITRILRATTGERKPAFKERLAGFLRPALQPRFAYMVAMAVFSFSLIINTTGIKLRHLRLADLNPQTWFYQANRSGHLLVARAEKFYYDLRVVYEIESRLRDLRAQPSQPAGPQEQLAPKPQAPAKGATDNNSPDDPQLAEILKPSESALRAVWKFPRLAEAPRSPSQ